MSNADRIMEALRASNIPLDDDELARLCGIQPRQQVNQICLRLEAEGDISRTVGPTGKVVNSIRLVERRTCLCGCGSPTGRNYRPGHDARHASMVGRKLAAAGDDVTSAHRDALLLKLPSDALRAKASSIAAGRKVRAGPAIVQDRVQPPIEDPSTSTTLPGSSLEQRDAERVMLDHLGLRLGVSLHPRRVTHQSGAYVEVDGASEDLRFLVECWAHQGTAKVAQKYKLVNDAVKLAWIAKTLDRRPERLILCVSDERAVAHLRGRSWQGAAIRDLGVGIEVVDLPASVVETIRAAQKRQFR